MITVIGKLRDIQQYQGMHGYNVMPFDPQWSPDKNRAWLDAAIARGDRFLIASADYSGEFLNELVYLMQRITGANHDV